MKAGDLFITEMGVNLIQIEYRCKSKASENRFFKEWNRIPEVYLSKIKGRNTYTGLYGLGIEGNSCSCQ